MRPTDHVRFHLVVRRGGLVVPTRPARTTIDKIIVFGEADGRRGLPQYQPYRGMSDVVVDTADGQSFRHADGRWILNQGA